MNQCPKCKEWIWRDRHTCPPAFEVRDPECGDEWAVIYATDPQYAAEKWAERDDCDSAEYSIVAGKSNPTVEVRNQAGIVTRWKVTGESVPQYSAQMLQPNESDDASKLPEEGK